ncbi:MAG TPA: ARMT1-like domain-containing protein, partial [Methanocella sp.]|nr:ARMT1-like domain-containing protein [Methanocella sp.]
APCLLNRVLYEAELSTEDKELRFKAVQGGLEYLGEHYRPGSDAIEISTGIHRKAYAILGDKDPYRKAKDLSNKLAAAAVPDVRARIAAAAPGERFRLAVLFSIAGNTFDFGVQGHDVETSDFGAFLDRMVRQGLDIDDTGRIASLARDADVLYLADNCGEIYFDELLIEQLKSLGAKVTLVVRGAYILTDVTMEDVKRMGLDKKVDRVLTTGSNAVGVSLNEAPAQLRDALKSAGLIISKGMANYESLSDAGFRPMAYLLRAKCEPVAASLGAKKGMNVAMLSG